MIVSAECRHCKTTDSLRVEDGPYNRWLNREGLVQDVFPDLTPDQRELLIGHRGGWFICHRCWDVVFGDDEEEEPEEGLFSKEVNPFPDGGRSEPSGMGGVVDA